MKATIFYSVIFLVFILTSCEKDDLTEPVSVDFEFTMDTFQMNGSTKSSASFEIKEGTVVISQIEFDGRRDHGEDYYFTDCFETSLIAQMHNKMTNENVTYDIPQGVYNRIELNLSLGDTSSYALRLKGQFQRGPMDHVEIVYEYKFQEKIRIRAINNQGNEQIVLSKNYDAKATVIFDAPYFFQLVSMNMIQQAETNNNVIYINNEINQDIFNLLATRLDNSMRVIFE